MWNQLARPTANRNAPIEAVRGHGLGSTRWNGCRGIYVSYWCRLFTWKVTVLIILKTYKRAQPVNKFTVYCLYFDHLVMITVIEGVLIKMTYKKVL